MTKDKAIKCIYAGLVLGMLAGILYLAMRIAVVVVPADTKVEPKTVNCDYGMFYDTDENGNPRETYIPALDTCSEK